MQLRGAPPLHRAVAVGGAFGPGEGLDLVEQTGGDREVRDLPSPAQRAG